MTKWPLLIAGVLLLTIGLGLFFMLFGAMRPADLQIAFEPLARIPLQQLGRQPSVDVEITAPNDAVWARIRRSWGNPKYAVALLSDERRYQHCFDGVSVSVTNGDKQLELKPSNWIYGYQETFDSGSCKSGGVEFVLLAGQRARVHVSLSSKQKFATDTELIVRSVWFYTKDNLVGLDLNEDLRPIMKWALIAGILITAMALLLFARDRGSRHQTLPPVDAST